MKTIVNVQTGEVIERELTKAELEQQKKDEADSLAKENALLAENAKKLAKKAEILARLGITEDEAKLLLA